MTIQRTPSAKIMKQINQQRVLQLIYNEGALSRVEISQKLGLTQQTITNIVGRLLQDGIVKEDEPVSSSNGGRKPVPVRIHLPGLHAIGIEVAVKHIRGVLVDFDSTVLAEKSLMVQQFRDAQHTLDCVKDVVDELLTRLSDRSSIQGMGVSVQGIVDVKEGMVLKARELKWNDYPLVNMLEQEYPFPIYIENDVNMVAVSQNLTGHLAESKDNLVIKIDRGIGGAIVIEKNLFTGHNHVAGEFGHYKVAFGDDALSCHCGGQGCLTTIASIGALEQRSALSFSEMKERIGQGDTAIRQLVNEASDAIALVISNLVTVLNPSSVLFTGQWLELAGEAVFKRIEEKIRQLSLHYCKDVKLIMLNDKLDGAQLASSAVVKQFFTIPTIN